MGNSKTIKTELDKKLDVFLAIVSASESNAADRQRVAEKLVTAEKAKFIRSTSRQRQIVSALHRQLAKGRTGTGERAALQNIAIQRAASLQIVEAMTGADGSPEKVIAKAAQAAFVDMLQQAEADTKEYLMRTNEIMAQIESLNHQLDDILELSARTSRISDVNGANCKRLAEIYEAAFGPIDVTGHTCTNDDIAKQHFCIGLSEGISDTPAFRGLIGNTERR